MVVVYDQNLESWVKFDNEQNVVVEVLAEMSRDQGNDDLHLVFSDEEEFWNYYFK